MKVLRLFAVAAFLMLGCSVLMAQTVVKADLNGSGEVPVVATNASGQAIFIVYPDRVEFYLTASSLGTEVQASHIHLGFPGGTGPIILPLYAKSQGPFTGRISGVLMAADLVPAKDRGVTTFEDATRAILGGRTYCNIHTTLVPGGEIRGQITRPGQD